MAVIHSGPRTFQGSRDAYGHRTYKVVHIVLAVRNDGPHSVMNCPGLPAIGSAWNFTSLSGASDVDQWAFCHPDMTVTIHKELEGDPATEYRVEQTFGTQLIDRPQITEVGNPLLEPAKVSGSFVKYTKQGIYAPFGVWRKDCLDPDLPLAQKGYRIESSSHELFQGAQNEWDANRGSVKIERNWANINLLLLHGMVDTVNQYPLWGCPARCVKLSNASWERKWWGTSTVIFPVTLEFDVNLDKDTDGEYIGFDRDLSDEGSKCLWGEWDTTVTPNVWETDTEIMILQNLGDHPEDNPTYFQRFQDKAGNLMRCPLDGCGEPAFDFEDIGKIRVKYYLESNFLLLGIPAVLEAPY